RKDRLYILGSGWEGYKVQCSTVHFLPPKIHLILLPGVDVISPNNYFNFTPLLASAAVVTFVIPCYRSVQGIKTDTKLIHRHSRRWNVCVGWMSISINLPATPSVSFSSSSWIVLDEKEYSPFQRRNFSLQYDKLVIAIGACSETFGIPAVTEHAHFLEDVKDHQAIRTRLVAAHQLVVTDADRRKLLNFVSPTGDYGGAGPTGVESAAELRDVINEFLRAYYLELARLAQINLFNVAPRTLGII
ncbi:hypothetical protein DFS33DRAFT_1267967, partial [Desarmillaria ectypa]